MNLTKWTFWGCLAASSLALAQTTAFINQVGYRTTDAKSMTLVGGSASPVEFVDASGTSILSVTPGETSRYSASNQDARLVDFSKLDKAGTFQVKQDGKVLRSDLKISDKTFEEVVKASIKFYYFQRSSMELTREYAGDYARAAGHKDDNVKLHSSTGESGNINSPKGWYDAGDFGKYIVNSGISTYTLLALYEHFPEYFKTLKWNIPADGSLPDLLAEIKYNLDWMLTMQASDGGVYHKLSTLQFPGDVMPAEDVEQRYVIGKGTAAALDFAAVMAVAYRVYKPFDATYSAKCLEAAKKAFAWASQNPNKAFSNPFDVATGEYGDGVFDDEKLFAATELFVSTGDATYKLSGSPTEVPSWPGVGGLATYEKAIHPTEFAGEGLDSLKAKADELAARAEKGFGVVMDNDDFVWGSNSVAGNQGIWLLHAYYMTGDEKYYVSALKVLDYLLGKNPLDMSFVTGFGTKSPQKPHHRVSTADNITAPVPGMLVGGPQPGGEDIGPEEWQCRDYRTGAPATSYQDNNCSYASNEVAINWNAPLAYLAGAVEALNNGYIPSFAAAGVGKQSIAPVRSGRKNAFQGPRLRFADQRVFLEKDGKRFDLKGHQIK